MIESQKTGEGKKKRLTAPTLFTVIAGRKRQIVSCTKGGRKDGRHHINRIKAAAF